MTTMRSWLPSGRYRLPYSRGRRSSNRCLVCNCTSNYFHGLYKNRVQIPDSICLSGIHRAVLEGNIDDVRRCIESGQSVNEKETQCNFTPLHVAVINNNSKMLEHLLAKKDVQMEARCYDGRTPLYLAASLGHFKSVKKLIEAGADVNADDNDDDRPLHVSVSHRDICQLLIQHGALINTNGKRNETLQEAVQNNCLEVVHMLLYYNVDANVDTSGCPPFLIALAHGQEEVQEVLLDYVDDFDMICGNPRWFGATLLLALLNNSPFVKDIVERGADVNYGDEAIIGEDHCAFSASLHNPVDLATFKMVWERLRFNDTRNTINFSYLVRTVNVPAFLAVIIESDNFEPAVEYFSKGDNYYSFINKYCYRGFDAEPMTLLTYRLLQYGFRASSYDVAAVFFSYGYCELFRTLLYMDNDLKRGWLHRMVVPRLIFDIDFDLKTIIVDIKRIPIFELMRLLEYSVCPSVREAITYRCGHYVCMSNVLSCLPRVPSLIELARNAARRQIWRSYKVTNNCQFYTIIDHLPLPNLYKDILKFKTEIYNIKM